MTDELGQDGLSAEELGAEGATALPDKEVVSILDLNADINLAIDAAAPIDLGAAANANVAAPIEAGVGANVLSVGSAAEGLSHQGVSIDQGLDANAIAHANQGSGIEQGASTPDTSGAAPAADAGATGGAVDGTSGATDGAVGSDALNGNLLNVDVKVDANADVAAPINGAVAANANVAAPIDASLGANVGSVGSEAVGAADQTAIIHQDLHGTADASSDQSSNIQQP
jgi:hypothetical protein